MASTDSAISAEKTSKTKPFYIDNCMFVLNIAHSNTISLKDSDGKISNSIFADNEAEVYTSNIFISFSNVNVSTTSFKDSLTGNKSKALAQSQI